MPGAGARKRERPQLSRAATIPAASRWAAMMDTKPFEKAVVVELDRIGRFRHIRDTQEAVECLMTVWPLNRGPRHRDAVEICLDVLEGDGSAADARRALIEAARESGVPVGEDGPHSTNRRHA